MLLYKKDIGKNRRSISRNIFFFHTVNRQFTNLIHIKQNLFRNVHVCWILHFKEGPKCTLNWKKKSMKKIVQNLLLL